MPDARDPDHQRGRDLAAALVTFLREEVPDRQAHARILIGARDFLDEQTQAHRPDAEWPSGRPLRGSDN